MADGLSEFFEDPEFRSTNLTGAASPENLFSMLETLDEASKDIIPFTPFDEPIFSPRDGDETSTMLAPQRLTGSNTRPCETDEDDEEASLARKKLKFAVAVSSAEAAQDGEPKMSHITVERNRRKQMNEHLSVLRSLMPCFYVKRGDQASIIGGVVDYIKELQQVLQSLEAKKQRKVYSEVLSPRPVSSPRPPPLSPRLGLAISPRTPQPGSPYKPRVLNIAAPPPPPPPPSSSHESSPSSNELAANSKSPVADIEVKVSGPNVILNTVSHRIPGQTTKIITALEGHSLEILQVNINAIDETMLNSFTIKIGIECELSAEELAEEIQQTFSMTQINPNQQKIVSTFHCC